jgi:type I restriction enzyme S subunit
MNWKTVYVADIATEDRRIIAPESAEAIKLPYLGMEQIEPGTGQILTYQGNPSEGKSTTFAFDNRHVLYGKLRPYLNKVAMPDRAGRCSTEIIPLLPKSVNREFLSLLLRSDRLIAAAMADKTGSRMPRADMDALMAVEVEIPEAPEKQRQIATSLNTKLAEVKIARKAAQAQADDIALLRTRALKDALAALDRMPLKVLGDHAPTTSGTTPSRSNKAYWSPAEIPWIKTGEVAFAPITQTDEAVSRKALDECSLILLPPKTVLVAMYGQGKTRGQSAILEVQATTNQACFAILPNETWTPEFLYLWLMVNYQNLRSLSEGRGGNQANLNGAMLKSLQVPAPSLTEQKEWVKRIQAVLSEVDAMKKANQTTLEELAALPQRLLAQAFNHREAT